MKIVIVGGVAGGATAAARIRRLDENAEIIVFERSGYISYANCGLPYYIGDVITEPEALTLQTPESFFTRFRVTMKVRHEITALHPDRKTVSVKNLETGEEFEESYDKLILSPGAKPTQPRLPGVGLEKLFTLRTVEDTFRIKEYINTRHPKSAVLAGGGFIGLELAENLRELGMDVTIVQRPKQLMNPFDPDMASFIHSEMRRHGIRLALGHTVEGFEEKDGGVDVLLKDEAPLHADMVVLAIGVTPDTALAKKAGLDTDKVILSPMSHAGYYPGGKVMTMKVVFEKETYRLLGAQIVGYEGVDKRIDVLATAIHAGMKATELKDLDLAYAPPYSSAKDPVNMAGFMIDNISKGTLKQWHLEDADSLPRDGSVTLLDVRTPGEYSGGHVEGFKNIPVDELREHLEEIEKNKPVYVICQSGLRSYIATRILEGSGYEAYNFSGGFRFYDAVNNDRCLIRTASACGMDQ